MIKYRFKGKVNSSFIIRGLVFQVGSDIDFGLTEKELEFVKAHCDAVDIIDLYKKDAIEIPNAVLEEQIKNKPKEVENELRPKQNGGANKGKHKAKV